MTTYSGPSNRLGALLIGMNPPSLTAHFLVGNVLGVLLAYADPWWNVGLVIIVLGNVALLGAIVVGRVRKTTAEMFAAGQIPARYAAPLGSGVVEPDPDDDGGLAEARLRTLAGGLGYRVTNTLTIVPVSPGLDPEATGRHHRRE